MSANDDETVNESINNPSYVLKRTTITLPMSEPPAKPDAGVNKDMLSMLYKIHDSQFTIHNERMNESELNWNQSMYSSW